MNYKSNLVKKKIIKKRKKTWSKEEDELLIKIVKEQGPNKWSELANYLPNREGKQCRERWHNHLNPQISKCKWNNKEEWILFLLHKVYGNSWALISQFLKSRTDNTVKNHWNSIMKRKIKNFEEMLFKIIHNKENWKLSDLEIELINQIIKGDLNNKIKNKNKKKKKKTITIKNPKIKLNNLKEINKTPQSKNGKKKNLENSSNTFYNRIINDSNKTIDVSSNEKLLFIKTPNKINNFDNKLSSNKKDIDIFDNFDNININLNDIYENFI